MFRNLVPYFFDVSSASGYMGATYFQEFCQKYMPVLCQEYKAPPNSMRAPNSMRTHVYAVTGGGTIPVAYAKRTYCYNYAAKHNVNSSLWGLKSQVASQAN